MKQKKKMNTSTKIVIASIIFTTIFTIVAIVTQFITGEELSSTLITCVFAYWGTELISLAAIRSKKLAVGYNSEIPEEEFCEDVEECMLEDVTEEGE